MKNFKFLIAAVAALSAAAWLFSHKEEQKFASQQEELLLPKLDAQLGDIDQVTLQAAGGETVTLKRQDGSWGVAEREGFTADTKALRRELRKLAMAKIVEAKTSQAALYERLGVQDVDLASDTTLRIRAMNGADAVLDLLIGKSGKRGSYVRLSDQSQSWLIDSSLNLPRTASAWLDKALLDIPRAEIGRIEVQPLEGPAYSLEKADKEQPDFDLTPPAPEGRELNMANINRLAAALAGLRLNDVALELPEDLAWSTARYRRFDGLIVQLKVAKQGSDRYLQLTASVAADAAEDSGVAAEAERINALARSRSFKMGQYAVDAMALQHEMLLQALPEDAS